MEVRLSFPRYGRYTDLLAELFRNLGIRVIMPPPITRRTVELGTKYAPGDVCYPFKITLGTMIEALESGANTLIMANSDGWCILRCYSVIQETIMRSLGHEFRMCPINVRRPVEFYRDMKRISPGLSFRAITREMMRLFNGAKELDEAEREVNRSSDIRVGLAGELYVTNESAVNMEVVNKLQQLGVFVDRWLCLSNNVSMLVREMLHISNTSRYGRIARRYFPQRIGGHANENLVKLVRYAEEGYDGAIMLKPFACNPETVIEPIVDRIGRDYDMPILWLSIDESTLETHFETRIESFVDMLRMRKGLS